MTEYPVMYGCWIRGKGWLRGENNRALMFALKEIATETARRVGNCEVYFIDQSLVDIETQLLEAEAVQIPLFKRIFRALKA